MEVIGYLEPLTKLCIRGWACDLNSHDPVFVEISAGDILLKTLRADQPRRDLERRTGRTNCGFSLLLGQKLVQLLPKGASISARVNGQNLACRAESLIIAGGATDGGRELKAMLGSGYVVNKWGVLKKTFACGHHVGEALLSLYDEVNALFTKQLALPLHFNYGSLLGLVRDGEFIKHDDDIDVSYSVQSDYVSDVSRHFHKVLREMIEPLKKHEMSVHVVETGQFSVWKGENSIDVFTSWINQRGHYHCYFGIIGQLSRCDVAVKEVPFLGHRVLVPVEAERILASAYGEDWRKPDPHFQWHLDDELGGVMSELREAGQGELAAFKASSSGSAQRGA